jgi:hypothetical protein
MTNRRDILKAGTGTIALAGLFGVAAPAAALETTFSWNYKAAGGLYLQSFWLLHPEQGARAFKVVRVLRPTGFVPQVRFDQFTMTFDSVGLAIAAGTYELDHPTTGRISLYLKPCTSGVRNSRYTADFSLYT